MSHNDTSATDPIIRFAAIIIIVAGMKHAAPILNPLFLSLFIAIMCWPVLLWLGSKGVPSFLAVSLVILALIVLLLGLGAYVASAAHEFSMQMGDYQASLQTKINLCLHWFHEQGITLPKEKILFREFNTGKIIKFFGGLLSGLGNVFANVFFMLLTIIFILFEAYALPNKLHCAFSDSRINDQSGVIIKSVKQYLVIKVVTSLVTGVLITFWLVFLELDFPVLWGVIAFMLNFVPNIGSIIAAIPTVFLALVQMDGTVALWVASGYMLVNTVIGNIWEPRVMGRGLGLSTLVVFLSLAFWGWVFGTVGMLLSVPFTMIFKIIMEHNENTLWIAILLGSEDDLKVLNEEVKS